jgi:uncharacterized cupin superfamily protein
MKAVVSLTDIEATPGAPVQPGGAQMLALARLVGLSGMGCMYVTVPPGEVAFSFQNHNGNDELFVILEGEGVYRLGDRSYPIRAGDVCAAPRGGADTAHQIINTGTVALGYLGVATVNADDEVGYPDDSARDGGLRFVNRTEAVSGGNAGDAEEAR